MIRAGHIITNSASGGTITVLESDVETKGMGFYLESRQPAGAMPDVTEHFHETWTETFEIISGKCRYKLNGERKTAEAGETLVFPPRIKHIHPWPAGKTELVYRQRSEFPSPSPEAVQDTLGVFSTLADLPLSQRTKKGLPKNPLLSFAVLRALGKHGGFDASIPVGTQKFLNATMGVLAEMLGVHGVNKKYR